MDHLSQGLPVAGTGSIPQQVSSAQRLAAALAMLWCSFSENKKSVDI